ncbi:hypothetical protein OX284_016115 [Flavobacterium sp. SUN046]|uniref:hypothetical protein n=1 Tax=Flavobacterium sp. SUN046 TaxID=3002440 RepID=UPI002DBA9E60|nr:hypothetical protein [Flavobacterium sp. SUN046]MEC4050962.1 hypothetical protein [Flavobacterium sp. SUN046]
MKKTLLLLLFTVCSVSIQAQKSKAKTSKTSKATPVLAKVDHLVLEVKEGNFQLSINENGVPKDAIIIKTVEAKFAPTNCVLKSFKANGATLYLLTWSESQTVKTDTKTEVSTINNSNIYDIVAKKQVFTNTHTTTEITEKVFLDKNKTVSETQQRKRKEGLEFVLNPDGSIVQKGKNQENKWSYNVAKMEYVDAKKKK